MKRFILSIALTLVGTVSSFAQLTEGHVKYEIDVTSDNPEMEMAISMMQGSTLDIYFSGDNTRTEMSMGSMMNIATLTNGKTEEMLMLMSGMMGNKAVKSTFSEVEDEAGEQPEFDVELVDETKEIQGYTCKKAILTDDNDNEMTFWYTEEIEVNKTGQNYLNEKVPGFPLEFQINQGDMVMGMICSEFSKKIKDADAMFDMTIPEGYTEMTMEDLQNMGM